MPTATIETHAACDAREAYALLGKSSRPEITGADVPTAERVKCLTRAYACGIASIGHVTVTHEGYQRDATEYRADTALYRVTIG